MKIKYLFMLAAPLVFLALAACNLGDTLTVSADIPCPLPLPVITDSTATGTFNAACPYLYFFNDTLVLVIPGQK